MKKLVWIISLLGSMLLFSSNDMICNYCHGNVFGVSDLQSKEEWKVLTSDGGKKLQEIHQYNLGVLAYLQSKHYDQKKLYDYASFHANSKREIITKEHIDTCAKCHDGSMRLADVQTKDQWDSLLKSLDGLKKVHQNELKVIAFIESKKFKQHLPEFIESIKFHAPEILNKPTKLSVGVYSKESYKKIELKTFEFQDDNILFSYKKMDGKEEEAEKIYKHVRESFEKCKLETPVTLQLKDSGWKIVGSDAIMWVLTFSLADVRSTMTITLEAMQNGKMYSSKEEITRTSSWFKEHSHSNTVFTILEKLTDDIIKQSGLECKN